MPQSLSFILLPGFSAIAFFSALEPLRIANRLAGKQLYAWTIHATSAGHVTASNGMQLRTDPANPDRPDALILCAGFDPLDHAQPGLLALIRRLWRAGCQIGAIDTGAFLLAEAGILGSDPITLHWEAADEFRHRYPHIPVSAELYERHARLFTCAGGAAAMDMMLDSIAANHGLTLANAVSDQLIHDRIRPPSTRQRTSLAEQVQGTGAVVQRLVGAMETGIASGASLETILELEGTSRRQTERLFLKQTGSTPGRFYRDLRLRHALQMMRSSRMSVHEAALAAGFTSQPVFSRACKQHFGLSPRALLAAPNLPAALGHS